MGQYGLMKHYKNGQKMIFAYLLGILEKKLQRKPQHAIFNNINHLRKLKLCVEKMVNRKDTGSSHLEPGDCINAMKEENGRYLGSR